MEKIRQMRNAGDFFAAIEEIQQTGTPLQVGEKYASLVSDLYWKARDLPAVVAVGRAGILYCLDQSRSGIVADDLADRLRSRAKALAYDVGSFTWPGWDEPGIHPTAEDLRAGRECAQLNLQLAIELKKPASRISMAHWLVGAHALAAGNLGSAEQAFRSAVEVLPDGDPETASLLLFSRGWVAVAHLCDEAKAANARIEFDRITLELSHRSDEDSKSYLAQLRAASRLFAETPVIQSV